MEDTLWKELKSVLEDEGAALAGCGDLTGIISGRSIPRHILWAWLWLSRFRKRSSGRSRTAPRWNTMRPTIP